MTTLQVELLYEEQDVVLAPLPPVLEIVLPDSETFIPVSVEFVTGGGGSSSSIVATWEAGESISSGRLLEVRGGKVYYHDPDGTKEPYGIAGNAALTGDNVIVTSVGDVTISGWGLMADAVYFSKGNGAIGITPNATTRAQVIGKAVKTDTLNINIQQSIKY